MLHGVTDTGLQNRKTAEWLMLPCTQHKIMMYLTYFPDSKSVVVQIQIKLSHGNQHEFGA
jgi:hypothetical protein